MQPTMQPTGHVDTFCRHHLPPEDQWPDLLFDLPELQYPDRLNASVALLDDVIAEHGPDRPCLHAPGLSTWTYADLLATANRVAHVLTADLGVVPGNRVLLRGPNNPWLATTFLGVLRAGAVAVVTMPLLRAGELATIHEIAGIDVALCDHRFLADLEGAALGVRTVPYGGEADDDLTRRAEVHPGTFDAADTAADDVALLAFTSGTTGRPKGTMHFHRDLLAIADTFSRHVLRPSPGDVFVGTPPFAFTFGLGGLLLFPLHAGAATLLVEKATPAELAQLIDGYGVTTCFTAPTAYKAMLAADKKVPTLRKAVSAGEHLARATWEAFRDATGVEIIDGIGSTEMLHIVLSNLPGKVRYGTTGWPVPGYEIQLRGEDGGPVPDGEPGDLYIQGPSAAMMYWGNRAKTRETFQGGWTKAGDKYVHNADGSYTYSGRSDDMLKVSGIYVSPFEVEATLVQHPAVLEAAVIGKEDAEGLTKTKAFVVLKSGASATEDELKAFVKDRLAPYKYPRYLEFVSELPKTATGKIQRFKLREKEKAAGG